MELTGLASV